VTYFIELVQSIFKSGDTQHACLTPDKELNSVKYEFPFHVIVAMSYNLLNQCSFLDHPVQKYIHQRQSYIQQCSCRFLDVDGYDRFANPQFYLCYPHYITFITDKSKVLICLKL